MEKYNYKEVMLQDILSALEEYDDIIEKAMWYKESPISLDRNEVETILHDELWDSDMVTGNASGSYFCNGFQATACVMQNLDILLDALDDFDSDRVNYRELLDNYIAYTNKETTYLADSEYYDLTIRCYLLSQVISENYSEIELKIMNLYNAKQIPEFCKVEEE